MMLSTERDAWHVVGTELMAESAGSGLVVGVQVPAPRHFLTVCPSASDLTLLSLSY